jgi:4'-phosphopantetheinyl transferase
VKLTLKILNDVLFQNDISPISLKESEHCFIGEAKENADFALLSVDERQKATSFKFKKDEWLYALSHQALRKTLSHYLNCPPQEIIFEEDENKKPFITSPTTQLHFNLSHSQSQFFFAVAETNIGVDVEFINSRFDFNSVIENYFSKSEQVAIRSAANPHNEFFRYWTIKESILKFLGTGITDFIKQIDLSKKEININGNVTSELYVTSFLKEDYAYAVCCGEDVKAIFFSASE